MLVHKTVQAIFEIIENFNQMQLFPADIGNYHLVNIYTKIIKYK